jgi:hypothetical protein
MGETRDETIARLRKRLGREPTKDEIDVGYKEVIRRAYADMAVSAASFLGKGDLPASEQPTPSQSVGTGDTVSDSIKPNGDDTTSLSAQIDPVDNSLDDRKLFDRVALPNERYDDEWIEDVDDMIRSEGRLVGQQEWDSGGPGAGAGTVDVYQFRGVYVCYDDVNAYGPFEAFADAAAAVDLFTKTEATTRIWVDVRFKKQTARGDGAGS